MLISTALRLDAKMPTALYGRGYAKLKRGNAGAGNADIAAAQALDPKIATEFAGYGLQ
ncbi:MAG: hypothetical protein WBX95_10280 [Xanthobacteraceae bacterium]